MADLRSLRRMTNGKMFKRKLARQLRFINVLIEGITESLVGKGFLFHVVTSLEYANSAALNAWSFRIARPYGLITPGKGKVHYAQWLSLVE